MMKAQKSVFRSIILNASSITLLGVLVMAGLLYQSQIAPIEGKILNETLSKEQIDIDGKIQSKLESVRAFSMMAAQRSDVIQALQENNREIAIPGLKTIQPNTAKMSDYKTVLIHIIDANRNSFIKAWSIDKFGEQTVNSTVKKTLETQQSQINFGVSLAGVGVIGVAPIFNGNTLLGVSTAYQGVGSITRELQTQKKDWLLVVDDQVLQKEFGSIPSALTNNIKIGERFRVAHNKWFEQATIDYVQQHASLLHVEKPTATLIDNKIVSVLPIMDSAGLLIGRHVFISNADTVIAAITTETQFVTAIILGIVLLIITIISALLWRLRVTVVRPIENATISIHQMIDSGKFTQQIAIAEDNEIGSMIKGINHLSEAISQAVTEVNTVVAAIAAGDLSKRIDGNYIGDLDQLKQSVNTSVNNIAQMIKEVADAMHMLRDGKFINHINTNAPGEYGVILQNAEESMQIMENVISDINTAMGEMNAGNFDARVNANAHGELLTLKENFNRSMSTISGVISSIVTVVESQAMGDLTKELPSGT